MNINKKYSTEFPPRIGDRVYCPGRYTDLIEGKIIDIIGEKVLVKCYEINTKREFHEIQNLYFRYEKPWYALFG
jgi:hypothetical protein